MGNQPTCQRSIYYQTNLVQALKNPAKAGPELQWSIWITTCFQAGS